MKTTTSKAHPAPKPATPKRGRPKSTIAKQKLTVSLPPEIIEQITQIGEGLPSRGIERLVEQHNKKH